MTRRRTSGARHGPAGGGGAGGPLIAGVVVVVVVAAVTVTAALFVASVVTGCGSGGAGCGPVGGSGSGHARSARGFLVSGRVPGPPGGSRAVARALGWRMLAGFRAPAGARRAGRQAWIGVGSADRPGPGPVTTVRVLYQVPVPISAIARYLRGRVPAGMAR